MGYLNSLRSYEEPAGSLWVPGGLFAPAADAAGQVFVLKSYWLLVVEGLGFGVYCRV